MIPAALFLFIRSQVLGAFLYTDVPKELLNNINEIVKFRFYIITDRKLSERVKNIKKEDIANKPVELNVWDIKRMYDIYSSSLCKESIEIDFSEITA